jgi:hypothetical protein
MPRRGVIYPARGGRVDKATPRRGRSDRSWLQTHVVSQISLLGRAPIRQKEGCFMDQGKRILVEVFSDYI